MTQAMNHCSPTTALPRRDFLRHASLGFAAIALADRLAAEGHLIEPGLAGGLHHEAKAKRLIHIFLGGGLSHIDSFDYKPELERYHDRDMPETGEKIDVFNNKIGRVHKSHFEFRQRGRSGLWISELFPELAQLADDLTVVRSMVAETANHIPGIFQANTGFRQMGFPSLGAWLSYGLGSLTEDLPSFVVLPDVRGIPHAAGGTFNWINGFLPARHQGVAINPGASSPLPDLEPRRPVPAATRVARLELLGDLHRLRLHDAAETDPLLARIRSYELAAAMQASVPEALDLETEDEGTRSLYGLDRKECRDFGLRCLAARRLLERGTRMVQIWSGTGVSWDSHSDILGEGERGHLGEGRRIDRPLAGLIRDLKRRGLLDDTLVAITTEFGRTPFAEAASGTLNRGRDHHPQAFANVLCGAGLKPGIAYGATDDFGYGVVDHPVTTPDLHATMLHLLGLDHERLVYYHNGIQRRLTNVHGHVVKGILA